MTAAVLVSLLVLPAAARATDPDAPPGAPADWLPSYPWVMRHWLPYDEGTLLRILHTDRIGLDDWLNDKRTLRGLARHRHLDPRRVLRELVRPWRSRGRARQRLMLGRARLTFTQPHLATHMFFHPFHIDLVNQRWSSIFGASVAQTSLEMHTEHISYLDAGARHRGSATVVLHDFRGLLCQVVSQGRRQHEMLPSQTRRVLAFDLRESAQWLSWTPG